MQLRVKTTDDELQVLFAEAYAPVVVPDADGDVMTTEEIRKLAYRFMYKGDTHCVDTQHSRERNGSVIVESFIARKGDPDFIEGAWVVGIWVPDPLLWAQVKAGEFRGLSLDFSYTWDDVEYEIEIPEYVEGETTAEDGHKHRFRVYFDDNGNFLGGETDFVNGHAHKIYTGTRTQTSAGHEHGFSFVELIGDDGVVLVSESAELNDSGV
ncbi:hypothetical protein VH22019_00083 [Vibrio phage VH2_2019]|nr:hypothetical protein VH22019_00083 [Vibrio phage VH2_2019]